MSGPLRRERASDYGSGADRFTRRHVEHVAGAFGERPYCVEVVQGEPFRGDRGSRRVVQDELHEKRVERSEGLVRFAALGGGVGAHLRPHAPAVPHSRQEAPSRRKTRAVAPLVRLASSGASKQGRCSRRELSDAAPRGDDGARLRARDAPGHAPGRRSATAASSLRLPQRKARLTDALMLHAVTIRRLRLRVKDGGVGCDSIHGYAFRFQCSCGVSGRARGSRAAAVGDGQAHRVGA
jgi:hypothetical protein